MTTRCHCCHFKKSFYLFESQRQKKPAFWFTDSFSKCLEWCSGQLGSKPGAGTQCRSPKPGGKSPIIWAITSTSPGLQKQEPAYRSSSQELNLGIQMRDSSGLPLAQPCFLFFCKVKSQIRKQYRNNKMNFHVLSSIKQKLLDCVNKETRWFSLHRSLLWK